VFYGFLAFNPLASDIFVFGKVISEFICGEDIHSSNSTEIIFNIIANRMGETFPGG
jgi:hypothetical protein